MLTKLSYFSPVTIEIDTLFLLLHDSIQTCHQKLELILRSWNNREYLCGTVSRIDFLLRTQNSENLKYSSQDYRKQKLNNAGSTLLSGWPGEE